MNAIIVDDDVFFCKVVKSYCEKSKIEVLNVFHNPIEALDFMNENSVDLVVLDVHMPDLSGFDFLQSSPKTQVILTTTDESKAVEAFDYDVVDFLLKPVTFNRFLRAVQRVKKAVPTPAPIEPAATENPDFVYVNINKRLVKIAIESINFIKANGNYVLIKRSKDEELMVHTTLKKITDKLPKSIFHKVHRSYIVNVNKIVDIEDSSIVIDRDVIPIGKDYRKELLSKLHLLN